MTVYIVQGKPKTPIKVGYSEGIGMAENRRRGLQTAYPYPLRFLLLTDGDRALERHTHRALHRDRLLGEWFEWGRRVERFIDLAIRLSLPEAIELVEVEDDDRPTAHDAQQDRIVLSESAIVRVFGIGMGFLRQARGAGAGPPFVLRPSGNKSARYSTLQDVRAWLGSEGIAYRIDHEQLARFAKVLDGATA